MFSKLSAKDKEEDRYRKYMFQMIEQNNAKLLNNFEDVYDHLDIQKQVFIELAEVNAINISKDEIEQYHQQFIDSLKPIPKKIKYIRSTREQEIYQFSVIMLIAIFGKLIYVPLLNIAFHYFGISVPCTGILAIILIFCPFLEGILIDNNLCAPFIDKYKVRIIISNFIISYSGIIGCIKTHQALLNYFQ